MNYVWHNAINIARHNPMDQMKIAQPTGKTRGRPVELGNAKADNVTVRMPRETIDRIDGYAELRGLTRSDAIRDLVEKGLRR